MRSFPVAFLTILTAAAVADAQPQATKPASPSAPATTPDGKLPEGVRLRLGTNKFREPNYIQAASLSPDGKLIALANGSQMIRFIDVATGKEEHRINITDYMQSPQIVWVPDGKKIITCGGQGVDVWDAKTGKLIKQTPSADRNGNQGTIGVSDDGKFAAVGHNYQNGAVRVIDLEGGGQLSSVQPIQNGAVFGALSPKGEVLATWGQHYNRGNGKPEDDQKIARTIQLWDAKEGKEKRKLETDVYQISSVRFSPDGTKVAAGGTGVVQVWEVATGKLVRRFAGRTGQGSHLTFSPDGKIVSAASGDGCVQSWDVTTGKRAGICEGPVANVGGMQYRPDGQLLAWATNANALEIWEVPSGKRLTPEGGHTAPVNALQFSADNKVLISCGQDGKILRWDPATGKELEPFHIKERAGPRRRYVPPQPGPSHFSPNGKYLIAAGSGGTSSVWDVDAGQELFALASTNGYVDRSGIIAFSGDSTKLVAMNRYGGGQNAMHPIPVWDVESGSPLPPLVGQKGDFTAAVFSTDGNILVTAAYTYPPRGGQFSETWAWDLNTGKVLSKVPQPQNVQVTAMQFLDHRLYAVFTNTSFQPGHGIKVYDAISGREARSLELPKTQNQQPGQALALSPDRRLLAYAPMSYTYTARGAAQPASRLIVWEVASGSIRHDFHGPEGTITALAFSRDGKTLAAGCSDTTIYLWDLEKKPEKADPLTKADLETIWKDLDGSNAKKADEALRRLAARPAEAVPFLKTQLKPVPVEKVDPAKIDKLIGDLDAPRYAVREAAMRDLERAGGAARGAIQAALQKTTITPEVRERLEKLADLVNKPDTGSEWVRPLRALEALERIGTPDAVAFLKDLAAGGDAPPTRVAKEAVERLGAK